MSFIPEIKAVELRGKLTTDLKLLKRLYRVKKSQYMLKSVMHSLVEDFVKEGWEEYGTPTKTKTKIRKEKRHDIKFEDDIWCQLYELGYRHLNYDETFQLPFGKKEEDKKQIDVIAIDDETIILVECKSSAKSKKAPSYKDEFDLLGLRLDGFRKTMEQLVGDGRKLKFIFATRNLRLDRESDDMVRFNATKSFYFNDNTYRYVNSLIKSYKNPARYQFLGLLFKNELISKDKILIPAVEGNMGGKKYYMFSIEPELLLKMGFVLHRTKVNEEYTPNYQRLLVPSRLKGITAFIDNEGYFPNSLIVNFAKTKHKLQFESSARSSSTSSRFGMLKIPHAYSIAFIIDGQHRLYGYANSEFRYTSTIPVVAFNDLTANEQLNIFIDINQNQKAVNPSLVIMLDEDVNWDNKLAIMRLRALRSSIIRELSETEGPLYSTIEISAEPGKLSARPFNQALLDSGLLPKAKGNIYVPESTGGMFYNINNQNHNAEMISTKKKLVQFINLCYEFVEENYTEIYERERYFIMSNRGTYAFICLIGSLNKHLCANGELNLSSTPTARFDAIEKYLVAFFDALKVIEKEEEEKILIIRGSGAEKEWLYFFQSKINSALPEFNPKELIDWKERQDESLQDEGRKYGIAIEKRMKKIVLDKIKTLYKSNWELEINSIKRECSRRAEEEMERNYKEELENKNIPWTDMLHINDYKTIIKKYWIKEPETTKDGFTTFKDDFSIDIGVGFNSTAERIKWISRFNSYRNMWAHEGTKEKRLNREEVGFLEKIYNHFY
ncbi:DGQHR domain-containing protein [Maribacter chungangensis]|uniref:DGQHR domain-containing protein n=1 Tax=Maribacter chungangensis TaxID=1069117 RepID=A0ABW3B3N9_9FLAO